MDSTLWFPRFHYWNPDFWTLELGLGITIVSGIPDSMSKKFPDSVIRISVHGANGYVKVTFFRPANPFLAVQKSGAHMLFIVFIACFIVNDSKSVHAGQKKIIQW